MLKGKKASKIKTVSMVHYWLVKWAKMFIYICCMCLKYISMVTQDWNISGLELGAMKGRMPFFNF